MTARRARGLSVALLVCTAVGVPAPALAQSLLVEVVEEESSAPLSGAFVTLLDDGDHVLRRALTSPAGRTLFAVPGPGRYRVRAELIGRETQVSPPVALAAGQTGQVRLALASHAIPLAGIEVEADRRCRIRPDEASEMARVWEEARKALTVQTWTEQEGIYRLEISTWERDLEPAGLRVERETRRDATALTRTPFVTLPPEDLARDGFVRPLEGGGYQYYAPDAATLLSEPFLDGHCFRLTRSDRQPGALGLSFEPASRGGPPDVEGTLWLDQETGRLRFLEFHYTWAPWAEARGLAEGRVEFEAMPDGAWIVQRWRIRAPVMAQHVDRMRAGDPGIRVAAVRETGGEVTGVSTLDRRRIASADRGALQGIVWDSTRSRPLGGARVFLSGTQHATETRSDGAFRLEGLPDGVFTVAFTHPRLDSLGVVAPGVEAEILPRATAEVRLAVPSEATILLAACRAEEREEGGAVLSGVVRERGTGAPVPGARVRLEWQEVERTEPVVQARDRWMEVHADAEGRYTACGIPLDEAIRVRAQFLESRSEATEVGFRVEEHRRMDVEIGLPPGLLGRGTGAAAARGAVGAQGVQGVLLDPASGEPVRSAEVSLRDGAGQVVASAATDRRGFFRLQTPSAGRYVFSGRALGYVPVEDEIVEVAVGQLTVLDVRMALDAFELEPLVVTAERRTFHLEMEGFYDRRADGLGIFLPPELFERRRPRRVTDLLFGRPGVNVVEPTLGAGPRALYFRSGERLGQICWPMVYVDRHLVSTGGLASAGAEPAAVDRLVVAHDVAAVEVYTSPAEIPSEFNGPNAGCGVIVVWTHRGAGG